jgi:hypothetical protein
VWDTQTHMPRNGVRVRLSAHSADGLGLVLQARQQRPAKAEVCVCKCVCVCVCVRARARVCVCIVPFRPLRCVMSCCRSNSSARRRPRCTLSHARAPTPVPKIAFPPKSSADGRGVALQAEQLRQTNAEARSLAVCTSGGPTHDVGCKIDCARIRGCASCHHHRRALGVSRSCHICTGTVPWRDCSLMANRHWDAACRHLRPNRAQLPHLHRDSTVGDAHQESLAHLPPSHRDWAAPLLHRGCTQPL